MFQRSNLTLLPINSLPVRSHATVVAGVCGGYQRKMPGGRRRFTGGGSDASPRDSAPGHSEASRLPSLYYISVGDNFILACSVIFFKYFLLSFYLDYSMNSVLYKRQLKIFSAKHMSSL